MIDVFDTEKLKADTLKALREGKVEITKDGGLQVTDRNAVFAEVLNNIQTQRGRRDA